MRATVAARLPTGRCDVASALSPAGSKIVVLIETRCLCGLQIDVTKPQRPFGPAEDCLWHKVNQDYAPKILDKVQATACLSITWAMISTPTATMETVLEVSPLHQKQL
ncbi:hypothetical protein Trydic_g7480 [Trypoxylus dichotomus]